MARRAMTTRRAVALAALLAAVLWPDEVRAQEEPGSVVEVTAGAVASLSGPASDVLPTATVMVDAPLYLGFGSAVGRIVARGTFTGLPGQTVDLGDVTTFDAFEVVGAIERRIGSSLDGTSCSYVEIRGQFATKLSGDPAPRVRSPRAYGVGVAMEKRDDVGIVRRAELIVGRSQIALTYYPAIGSQPYRRVRLGDVIDQSWAEALFAAAVSEFEIEVDAVTRDDLLQREFDALVALAYNLPRRGFVSSTVVARVNARALPEDIAEAWNWWCYDDGRRVPGLVTRRRREIEVFEGGEYREQGGIVIPEPEAT